MDALHSVGLAFVGVQVNYHLPEVFPDENVYSLLARFSCINAFIKPLQAAQLFLNSNAISITDMPLPSHPQSLYAEYYSRIEGCSPLTLGHVRAHMGMSNLFRTSGKQPDYNLQTESFGDELYWRFCPECFNRDQMRYGIAYWHLTHQLPCIWICLEHACLLQEVTLKKKQLHDKLWFIHETQNIQRSFNIAINQHHINLAQLGNDALNDQCLPYDAEVVYQTIFSMLHRHRYVSISGSANGHVFEDAFVQFYGQAFTDDIKQRLHVKKPRNLLLEFLQSKGKLLNRMLIIYWLFGTWACFKENCHWHDVFSLDDKIYQQRKRKKDVTENAKDKCRALCESYILSTDKPNRIDFQRMFYGSFRFLLNHDRAWLDVMLPAYGFSRQLNFGFD